MTKLNIKGPDIQSNQRAINKSLPRAENKEVINGKVC